MRKITTLLTTLVMLLVLSGLTQAQMQANRVATIDADTLDVGGYGDLVAGVDFDGDGNKEIYAVNTDWFDALNLDLVPRIYKYEDDGAGNWSTVWSTRLALDFQNTWPALAASDLDNDGKMEITWGVPNNFGGGLQPNPDRIVVFETPGDGSDNMGLDNGDGTWAPNAAWTIVSTDNLNHRCFHWEILDIDGDGTDEIVAAIRAGGFGIEIYSVDDVPDGGGGTETWTTEFSQDPTGNLGTYYDMVTLGSNIYALRDNGEVTKISATGADTYVIGATQAGVNGGGSWKSAQVIDANGDGTHEIVSASWSSSNRAVYLLEESGDTLVSSRIGTPPAAANRLYGGAAGDVDGNGRVDFVFGTRQSTPNGLIYRMEYIGPFGAGGVVSDSTNWTLVAVDSMVNAGTQYDIVHIADVAGDSNHEVIYSGTARGVAQGDPPQPITVLNMFVTGIEDQNPTLAAGFELTQNYPNPFNPETSISFTIPQALNVSLKIYNIRGQEVKTLAAQTYSTGTHTVRWNGTSNNGARVASGVYVYTLRAGKFVQSKKMTILK